MATKMIGLDEIEIVPGRRASVPSHVDELALSIAEVGLLQPITVRRNGRGGYWLVSGRHRCDAMRKNGETMIEAQVVELDELRAELAEIDENLCRHDLTLMQRANAMARRKAIFLALNPEAAERSGAARKASGKQTGGRPAGNAATVATFAADTARATGKSVRTVHRDARIGEGLDPEAAEKIADKPVAKSSGQLEALASQPPAAQREIAAALEDDPEQDVRDIIRGRVAEDADGNEIPAALRELWATLNRLAPEAAQSLRAAFRAVQALTAEAREAGPSGRVSLPKTASKELLNLLRPLQRAAETCDRVRPYRLCPACEGGGCAKCHATGWQSRPVAKETDRADAKGKAALAGARS